LAERTILIVDDEPVVRALLRAALEPAGSRLVEAADGSEALESAWQYEPDVVLLDVGLPKLSGLDVCRALKTHPHPPRVLLMTGNPDAAAASEAGADGILSKPFLPTDVLAEVEAEAAPAAP
jgi:CheY-like chemotaxis protein